MANSLIKTAVLLCSHVFLCAVTYDGKNYPKGFLLPVEEGISVEKLEEWEKRELIKKIPVSKDLTPSEIVTSPDGKKPTASIETEKIADKKPVEEKK